MPSPELSCQTTHIGSLPFEDIDTALAYAFKFNIPAWPQLPRFKSEGMILQACEGLPGFVPELERIDLTHPNFEEGLFKTLEDYQRVIADGDDEVLTHYLPSKEHARALRPFVEKARLYPGSLVKGQITGPFTLSSALKDLEGQSLIFIPDLRELVVKFLTLKAIAQAKLLSETGKGVIIFLDEPGLAGFGSSGFLTVTKEEVISMLKELIQNLRLRGFLTGIHVCANTDWDLVLQSDPDIVSFDSFNFFEKFTIYTKELRLFLKERKRFIAWGCVPTDKENLERINFTEIEKRIFRQLEDLSSLLSYSINDLLKQSLFTPACGMGSLSSEKVDKVVEYLQKVQNIIINFNLN